MASSNIQLLIRFFYYLLKFVKVPTSYAKFQLTGLLLVKYWNTTWIDFFICWQFI